MAQKKLYTNDRYKTDIIYRLICKTRSRVLKTLEGMTKQSSYINIIGIDIDLYGKCLEFQFTPGMNREILKLIMSSQCVCLMSVKMKNLMRHSIGETLNHY